MNYPIEKIKFCTIVFFLVSVISISVSVANNGDETTTTSTTESTTTTSTTESTTTTTESTTTTITETTTTTETSTTTLPTTTTTLIICDVTASDVIFNSLAPLSSDIQDTIVSQVNGNTAASLSINGHNWNPFMSVGQTHWSTATTSYDDMNVLTDSFSPVGMLEPSSPIQVHLGVKIPPHQSSGSYTQEITFEAVC